MFISTYNASMLANSLRIKDYFKTKPCLLQPSYLYVNILNKVIILKNKNIPEQAWQDFCVRIRIYCMNIHYHKESLMALVVRYSPYLGLHAVSC